jgi:hypothetical protein
MTYAINGTEITIQPTTGRWLPQAPLGFTGGGVPIYPTIRTFQLRWNLVSQDVVFQLIDFFNTVGLTGTVVARLPQYNASTYGFYSYSGCVPQQPEFGVYFTEHTQDVVWEIGSIAT